MKYITYIVYSAVMYSLTFLPFFYVIFWKNASPWWFLLASAMASVTSSPQAWGLSLQNKEDKSILTDDTK